MGMGTRDGGWEGTGAGLAENVCDAALPIAIIVMIYIVCGDVC